MSNIEYITQGPDSDEPLRTELGEPVPKYSAAVRIVDGRIVGFHYDPGVEEYLKLHQKEIEVRLAAMTEEEKEEMRRRVEALPVSTTYHPDGKIEKTYRDGRIEFLTSEA